MSTSSLKDVFPDIHQKMCKKIAQLTKVIYHLNTQNEDHAYEVQSLVARHEEDIQKILEETALRFESFKMDFANQQAQVDYDIKLKKVHEIHRLEKETALADFQYFRDQIMFKEDSLIQDFKMKYTSLEKEINDKNIVFEKKIKLLDDMLQESKQKQHETILSHQQDIIQLNTSHDNLISKNQQLYQKEIDNLLIKHQQKLAENQSTLQQQHDYEKNQLIDNSKTAMAAEIMKINSKNSIDKSDALKSLQKDYDTRYESMQIENQLQIDILSKSLFESQNNLNNLQLEKETLSAEYMVRLESLQTALGDKMGDYSTQVTGFTNEITSLTTECHKFQSQVIERQEEIQRLQKLIAMKNIALSEYETQLKTNEVELSRLYHDIDIKKKEYTDMEKSYIIQIKTYEKNIESLHHEINTMATISVTLREEIKSENKMNKKLIKEYDEKIDVCNKEKINFLQQIDQLKINLIEQQNRSEEEIKKLNQQCIQQQEEFYQIKNELEKKHVLIIKELKQQHDDQIHQSLLDSQQQGNATHQQLQLQHTTLVNQLKQIHADEIVNLTNQYTLEAHNMSEKYKKSQSEWEVSEENLKSISEKEKLKLQEKLDIVQKIYEQCMSDHNDLKQKHLSSIDTYESSLQHFKENHILEIQQLLQQSKIEIEKYEKKEKDLKNQHDVLLTERINVLQIKHEKEMELLLKQQEDLIQEWKEKLNKEEEKFNLSISNQSENQQQLLLQLSILNQEKEELMIDSNKTIELLKQSHNNTMIDLQQQHNLLLTSKLDEIKTEYQLQYEALQTTHAKEKELLINEYMQTNQQSSLQAQLLLQSELSKLTNQLSQQHTNTIQSIENQHQSEILQINDDYTKKLFNETIEQNRLKASLDSKSKQLIEIEHLLQQERQERHKIESQFVLDKDQLIREYEYKLSFEKSNGDNKINDWKKQQFLNMENYQNQWKTERATLEEKILFSEKQYQNRSSRNEDIDRIKLLQNMLKEKDLMIDRIKDELSTVRRELLNREEVYNQKFNRSPNVGVMQVLKPQSQSNPSQAGNHHITPSKQQLLKNKSTTAVSSSSSAATAGHNNNNNNNTLLSTRSEGTNNNTGHNNNTNNNTYVSPNSNNTSNNNNTNSGAKFGVLGNNSNNNNNSGNNSSNANSNNNPNNNSSINPNNNSSINPQEPPTTSPPGTSIATSNDTK